jgi:hypothetical protein
MYHDNKQMIVHANLDQHLQRSPSKINKVTKVYKTGFQMHIRLSSCRMHTESRLEGVDRRNLKFINLSTHYKLGLALELNPSSKERENKSTKK